MSDELIGKTIGGYEIQSRAGRGGMATVYCARQTSMNRLVAIKVLPREMMNDDAYKQRFEREAYIVSQLEHRNIVPVFDYGQYEGQPYIVMRYMNSGSVDDLLAKGPLNMDKILDIMRQIAPALDYAHNKNVLHRDLKPSNILMDDDDGAYVTDFGISRILGTEGQGSTITTQGVVGTPSYMSPEQAQGQPLDARSDIYSLGVMLFEMATGRRPFQSDTPYSIAVMQVTTPPPSARSINPKISSAVEQVIYKAMKKKPQDRYQTATELAEALRMAIERPGDFRVHDTQPRPILQHEALQLTQPSSVPSSPYMPAPPQQSTPAYSVPPRTPQPSHAMQPVTGLRRRKKAGNGMWMGITIGAMIGCALLALVVVGLVLLADQFINSASATPTERSAVAQGLMIDSLNRTAEAIAETAEATIEEPTGVPSTRVALVREAAFDGRLVYFAERDGGFEIFMLNLITDHETQLTSDLSANQYPLVSPNGRRVVFQSDRDGDFDIYTMNTAGGNLVKVLNNNVTDWLPSWSPDSEWITFVSDTRNDGNYDLFMVRADGSNLRRLLTNGKRNSHPRWSPDGKHIVFTTGHMSDARTWEVAILDLETSEVTMLTEDEERDAWPLFSADGESVYYVTGSEGKTSILWRDADGSGSSEVLYESDNFIWGLNLSPDGQYLAFNEGVVENPTGSITLLSIDGSDHRYIDSEGGVYASWQP